MITLKTIVREALRIEKALFRAERRNGLNYYIYRKGDFSKDRNKATRLVWQKQGRRLFLSCPGCGCINEVSLRYLWLAGWAMTYEVMPGGFIKAVGGNNCLTCPECGAHFYAKLKGWETEEERP